MIIRVVELHVKHSWELLQRCDERLGEGVAIPSRLAVARQVDRENPVDEVNAPISSEAISRRSEAPCQLFGRRASEVGIQRRGDGVLRSRDGAAYRLIGRRIQ